MPVSAALAFAAAGDEFTVICLCAQWCGTCRDYRAGFDALAAQFPQVGFDWLDIEERADELGDIDVENFPTLAVFRGEMPVFFGASLPQEGVVASLVMMLSGVTMVLIAPLVAWVMF